MAAVLALAFVVLVTLVAYWPGLSGSFLFDDFGSLAALGDFNGVRDTVTFAEYLLGGIAGPTGRPLSLLSFLLNDYGWPSDPWFFKYTNLLLHLLTGLILCWLALELGRALGFSERQAQWLGILTSALWLLHPLHVSTTLYVVQRMTILSALFTLAGLLCYTAGRRRLEAGGAGGYIWMTAGVAGFGLLGVLSKENAVLLPVLCAVIEYTVFRNRGQPMPPGWRLWGAVFIVLPILLLIGYFAVVWRGAASAYAARPFTLGERLLTEARVLWDYLWHLVLPRMQTAGLYNDNFPASKDLLHPWTTLPAVVTLLVFLSGAFLLRKRFPIFGLGVLFFFAGHLLESTFLPLEIYFEHRNYLPDAMLFFALASLVVAGYDRHKAMILIGAVLIGGYGSLTWARASLWGNPEMLTMAWVESNPGSARARQQAADLYISSGRPDLALAQLAAAVTANPRDPVIRVQYLTLACTLGGVVPHDLDDAVNVLSKEPYHAAVMPNLESLWRLHERSRCLGISVQDLDRLLTALLGNPSVEARLGAVQNMLHLRGRLRLAQHRPREAFRSFQEAMAVRPNADMALVQSALLAGNGEYDLALQHLRDARKASTEKREGSWRDRLRRSIGKSSSTRFTELETAIREAQREAESTK